MPDLLPDWLSRLLDPWIEPLIPWLPWMVGLSVLLAVASTVALPLLILAMPEDYFSRGQPRHIRGRGPLAILLWLLRNLAGLLLILCGILMLVLPGQGLLTILFGIGLTTFPGKYRLEAAIMRRPAVFKACNWIRRRYHRPPLHRPPQP